MAIMLHHHLFFLFFLLPLCSSTDPLGYYCDTPFNGNPTQSTRITVVLSDLVSKASVGGFAVSSAGRGGDEIYGLAQCRGDVGADVCSTCLTDAAKKIPSVCPQQADARIWYDYCFMRYDNANFIGQSDTGYAVIYINVDNATNPETFEKKVGKLMTVVRAAAVAPGSGGLGRGQKDFTPYVTIYGLAQCTRDLSPLTCAQCLSSAEEKFADYCRFRRGCQVHYSSCMLRYEIYPFYFPLYKVKDNVQVYSKLILYP
ncbi:cysteine-rich repeat secretory protein 55-like [Typha angustifolia]|uniref:cysteine-rich repeat secretory protein 55-like n=1 Tax=Typha angustifolia TaxID=59011 RepID=UPI003C2D794F